MFGGCLRELRSMQGVQLVKTGWVYGDHLKKVLRLSTCMANVSGSVIAGQEEPVFLKGERYCQTDYEQNVE